MVSKNRKISKYPIISIIVPAKYEELSVVKTLEKISRLVRTPHEIVVVNDSYSDDKTGKIVLEYAKNKKNVIVIVKRNGISTFASAIWLGTRRARGSFIVPVMADLCDDTQDIDAMYNKICEGWDIVCASRYMPKGKKHGGPVLQSFFSWFVCKTIHVLTNIPTDDVSNTFKMYRKKIFETVIINQKSGVELAMSMTLLAYFYGARITQIPTVWHGRTLGYSKFKLLERTPRYLSIYLSAIRSVIKKGK